MNPPSILLDRSFLTAVIDTGNDNHAVAVATYRSLLADYIAQRCLIVARADHLRALVNPEVFAAVDKLHVARQHLYAAANLRGDQLDPDLAITLVLIKRLRIRKVASFDERLASYEITTLPTAEVVDAETHSDTAGDKVGPALT